MTPTRVKINVTAEDIQKGKPGHCDKCAIARAARRELGLKASDNVSVDGTGISVRDGAWYTRYFLHSTTRMQNFIERFDDPKRRKGLKPTTFQFVGEKY